MTMPASPNAVNPSPWWHLYVPKMVTVLKEGYSRKDFRDDVLAGLTVAIVAIPLSMALAIASGATPDKGLITVVIAGFLISLLSGSRYQVGGPAGAFVVIVFNIIAVQGYDGLVLATLMAGVIMVAAGLARFGDWIKYIPQPVITGFTSGIAFIIFSSQIADLFGLETGKVPGEVVGKLKVFWQARASFHPAAAMVAGGTIAAILLLRKYAPKLPALLIAVVGASVAAYVLKLDVVTIGSRFHGIPDALPAPHWPHVTWARVQQLMPSAFTIAFLSGLESLLCAIVADGMTGRRHRSNCELVAQGVANFGSALFGGMPATGTIARTATNVRAGAKSPVAGVLHAVFVLLCMMLFAPLASYIPLASLAGVLVIVAWNMAEREKFAMLLRGPRGDALVLLATFALTVLIDLPTAIECGVVMAAILFMHRMSQAVQIRTGQAFFEPEYDDFTAPPAGGREGMRASLPEGVEAFQVQGPLFFGVAGRLIDVLEQVRPAPKVFIVRMSKVPMIDSSGVVALEEFIHRCKKKGTRVILSGVTPDVLEMIQGMESPEKLDGVIFAPNFKAALERAESLKGEKSV